MSTWFISDLHLAPEETRITAGFLDFMLEPQSGDALYILGDFFNYWIGDDTQDPYIDQIKQILKATRDRGVAIYFMHGNRDFLLGEAFCNAAGMTLLADPTVVNLDDESVVLMHGDSLCTRDIAYMEFRKMARDPQWQAQFLNQSIEDRTAYAQKARDESKSSNSMKDDSIMDVTPTEVDAVLSQHAAKRMIHGHTHRPATHNWQYNGENRERIVLGDWYTHGWYLKVDNGVYHLKQFDLPNP
ncbi:UDP-2,3-diacylglucosamine diphosphatase [Oceaniserpentilla sp. 4NH20-0058]|uniref:UDP-2,3-diacylglucosamine diphosphatase n=1 Tax=Oceaniserpentilla sp. 4NH20-0058 TaxID=3127660 RepID=UPI003107A010